MSTDRVNLVFIMRPTQLKVLCLYFLLKVATVYSEQHPTREEQLIKYLVGLFDEANLRSSIQPMSRQVINKLIDSKQQTDRQLRPRPLVVRSVTRTVDNSIKLTNTVNEKNAPLVRQMIRTQLDIPKDNSSIIQPKNSLTSKNQNDQITNIKSDREGYSRDYRGIEYSRGNGQYGNDYDHSDIIHSESVKSYGQPPTTPPVLSSFSAPSPIISSVASPIVLSAPLPPIQRVVERVPVPFEVFRTVDRPVPVPIPLVREVAQPVPVDRIVPVDRPVPVPLIQQVPVPEPFPVPFIQHVPVPEPFEVIRHVPVMQPVPVLQPYAVDRPVYIERRIPVPIIRNIMPFPPPPPVRQTARLESTDYPFTVLKQRILAPFNGASFGRLGRFLRSVTCFRNGSPNSPRIAYKR